ncbi:MAG: PA2779 family protein [Nitrospiraceae bacterium]
MGRFGSWTKSLSSLLVFALVVLQFPAGMASAAIVSTETVLETSDIRTDRARVHAFLAREEVRAQLVGWGVSPDEVGTRVDALSDREVKRLAGQLDQLSAGQSVVGAVVGGIVLVFLVLLLTDIIGWTDIFPFVKKK